MKRPVKIAIWSVATFAAVGFALWVILLWGLRSGSGSTVEKHELSAGELSQSMRHLNPGIRVIAGFTASSYGGWHGDGGSVEIYLVDPSGADELIAGLKRFHEAKRKEWPEHYNYEWSESSRPDLSSLDDLIPKRFQPESGVYVIGRDRNGDHTISIERQKGYVCFASSRS
jgi:hypothetical protein